VKIELSCPSKTFLLGEYLVLNAGSALVLNVAPRFTLTAQTRGEGMVEGIHPNSPAGQWIRQNNSIYKTFDLQFNDPHNGAGGFGASSAQFLLVYLLTETIKSQKSSPQVETIWRAYRQLESVSQEGLRPSGADVAAQFAGGLVEVHTEPFAVQPRKWPFADFDVVLVHTGQKLSTHEHLRGLKRVDTEELEWIYSRAVESLGNESPEIFFDSVNDYHAELLELGLVAAHTQIITTTLLSKPFVRAVKGCGALGSDTVAIFTARENRKFLNATLREMNLSAIGDLSVMAKGYDIKMDEAVASSESRT
jgi:mevalonate kinase